jgi:hypothetical protein
MPLVSYPGSQTNFVSSSINSLLELGPPRCVVMNLIAANALGLSMLPMLLPASTRSSSKRFAVRHLTVAE